MPQEVVGLEEMKVKGDCIEAQESVVSYKRTCSFSTGMSLRFCSSVYESDSFLVSLAADKDSRFD